MRNKTVWIVLVTALALLMGVTAVNAQQTASLTSTGDVEIVPAQLDGGTPAPTCYDRLEFVGVARAAHGVPTEIRVSLDDEDDSCAAEGIHTVVLHGVSEDGSHEFTRTRQKDNLFHRLWSREYAQENPGQPNPVARWRCAAIQEAAGEYANCEHEFRVTLKATSAYVLTLSME